MRGFRASGISCHVDHEDQPYSRRFGSRLYRSMTALAGLLGAGNRSSLYASTWARRMGWIDVGRESLDYDYEQ